jgi:hypothetical protein
MERRREVDCCQVVQMDGGLGGGREGLKMIPMWRILGGGKKTEDEFSV